MPLETAIRKVVHALRLEGIAKDAMDALAAATPAGRRARDRTLRFYGQFVGAGSLCFDVGANVGKRTEVFLALGARVVAVEPQPACLRRLRRRCANNDRAVVVDRALGAREGEAEMLVSAVHTLSSFSPEWVRSVTESGRFRDYAWDRRQRVPVTTLDALIATHGVPDFCKIDVEGYESQVLAGLSGPLPMVSFEFAPEFLQNALACVARLETLGTNRYNYSLGESMTFAQPAWMPAKELTDALESLPDPAAFGDVYARHP
jgi:FkbM family methyltransferase